MKNTYDKDQAMKFIDSIYEPSLIKSLSQFIEIPNLSREFDKEYLTNGLLEKAANHIKSWVEALNIKGLTSEIIQHHGKTPIIFTEIQGTIKDKTIMFYGHFDKQPHLTDKWDIGKSPIKAVIEDGKLYGRGGADDGYSTYCSMLAVKAVQEQGLPLPRIIMITEGDEESGGEIQEYIAALKEKIGNLDVIFCLDSGTFDYERLWLTKSLRGYLSAILKISVLRESVHSGESSGIVPSCFKIANLILNRLQNSETGKVHKHFNVDIPSDRYQESFETAEIIGKSKFDEYHPLSGVNFTSENTLELFLNRNWRPQLTVTGLTNFPEAEKAGNAMISNIELKLSLRLPPTLDANQALIFLEQLLTQNPPFGAHLQFIGLGAGEGFNSKPYQLWLENSITEAGKIYYGKQKSLLGEGGSIPLMGFMANIWPKAQFLITGVLGPNSNAHGPNEFLHIDYTRKLTYTMAHVLAKSAEHYSSL